LTRGYAGRLTDRIGARPIVLVGFILTMAGTLAYTQAGVNTNELLLGASLVLRGPASARDHPCHGWAYLSLRSDQVAHASIATRITSQLGGAFGAAVFALILQTQLAANAAAALRVAPPRLTAHSGGRSASRPWHHPALFLPGTREVAARRAEQAQELAARWAMPETNSLPRSQAEPTPVDRGG